MIPNNTHFIGSFPHGTGMEYFFDENMVELGYSFNNRFYDTTKGRQWGAPALQKLTIYKIEDGRRSLVQG